MLRLVLRVCLRSMPLILPPVISFPLTEYPPSSLDLKDFYDKTKSCVVSAPGKGQILPIVTQTATEETNFKALSFSLLCNSLLLQLVFLLLYCFVRF